MKKTTKTIIIGIGCTLLAVGLTLGLIFAAPSSAKEEGSANNDVTVYIFHSTGCPHCRNAMSYFREIVEDYDYLTVKAFQIDGEENATNAYLMNEVGQALGLGDVRYIPFIIVGSDYHETGFDENALLKAIKKEHTNKDYKDEVAPVIEEHSDFTYNIETIKKN